MSRLSRLAIPAALGLVLALLPGPASAHESESPSPTSSCKLDNGIKHVIFVVFDNTHFTRDNPNVPSDLEQMPHLLNFLQGQGTLLTNEHTPLIAHTATDILTSLTGVYGDRHGVPISNSFRYYNPNGTTNPGVSFAYWTAPIFDFTNPSPQTDTTFNMLTAQGKNAPAPWVPYTRAGCNVGGVATANIELENTAIDIPTVFGAGSPEAIEAAANPDLASGDFVGIAVHCAKSQALCSTANNSRPDLLPQEPGGYHGYQGLFGHKYVAPALGGFNGIDGTPIPTFPGFDGMIANTTLGYVAKMQENGVPVTYSYISDAHAGHGTFPNRPFGPGEAPYVAQLKQYDQAFAGFFDNLNAHGINRSNTLFSFTSDEGDHLIAGPASPAGCDGVTVPCTYSKIGEVSGNLSGLIATEKGITTTVASHADSAINVYITGNPAPTSPVARDYERAAGTITALNPYTGLTETVDNTLADRAEMNLLHMHTADPNRDPTFTMFAKPDYFLFTGAPNCKSPCISINAAFNWNHGDVAPEINTTWLGFVGPGVARLGVDNNVWTDHADIRPTILSLIGLKDDYSHQGRVINQIFGGEQEGQSHQQVDEGLNELGAVYKQINAPVGQLSLDSLAFATKATLSGTDTSDGAYVAADAQIASWTTRRNALARQMESVLEGAEFRGREASAEQVNSLIERGQDLLAEVHAAAV